jgi:hypothetical protein
MATGSELQWLVLDRHGRPVAVFAGLTEAVLWKHGHEPTGNLLPWKQWRRLLREKRKAQRGREGACGPANQSGG